MFHIIKHKIKNYFRQLKNEVLEIPMSEYQFVKYAYVRKQEIDADKNKKKKDTPKGAQKKVAPNLMQMTLKCLKISLHIGHIHVCIVVLFSQKDIPRPTQR